MSISKTIDQFIALYDNLLTIKEIVEKKRKEVNNYYHYFIEFFKRAKEADSLKGVSIEAINSLKDRISIFHEHNLGVGKQVKVKNNSLGVSLHLAAFQLAKIAAVQDASDLSWRLGKYKLTEEQRFEVVKIIITQGVKQINIKDYKLNEGHRFEVAKIFVLKEYDQYGGAISSDIENYELKNPQQLFEIAKIAAAHGRGKMSYYIECYKLNEKERFEVAKIAAAQSGSGISEYIRRYKLSDQQQRFEVAKIAAAHDGWKTSENIEEYELSKEECFELAKIAAANSGWGTAKCIRKYKLLDQQERFEVAKIIAAQCGNGISRHIKEFKLNEKQRFEVAKIAAAQSGSGISKYIRRYKLNDQKQRFEVAKIAATKEEEGLSRYIRYYKLEEKQRFEVAKIAAVQNGGAVLCYIVKFKLSEKQRFEVAKIVVGQDWRVFSYYIEVSKLSKEHRFEIAKIIAAQDGEEITRSIGRYKLNEEQRFEVAKIAAAQNGSAISQKIERYALVEPRYLQIVLAECVAWNPYLPYDYERFGIKTSKNLDPFIACCLFPEETLQKQIWKSKDKKLQLLRRMLPMIVEGAKKLQKEIEELEKRIKSTQEKLEAAKKTREVISTEIQQEKEEELEKVKKEMGKLNSVKDEAKNGPLVEIKNKIQKKISSIKKLNQFLLPIKEEKHLQKLCSKYKQDLKKTKKTLKKEQEKQHIPLQFLATVGYLWQDEKVDDEAIIPLYPILEGIIAYQRPHLRFALRDYLFTVGILGKKSDVIQRLLKDFKANANSTSKTLRRNNAIFALLLTPYAENKAFGKLWEKLKHILSDSRFKDANKADIVIQSLLVLGKNKRLNRQDKIKLLELILAKLSSNEGKEAIATLLKGLQILKVIIESKLEGQAKGAKVIAEWDAILEENFVKLTGIEASAIKDFRDKFLKTFAAGRMPEAIKIYASKIQLLSSKPLMKTLSNFVLSVLNETFPDCRYRSSEHLKIIFANRAEQEKIWRKGASFPLSEYLPTKEANAPSKKGFDVFSYLRHRVLVDEHIDPNEYSFLSKCLKDPNRAQEVLKNLKEYKRKIKSQGDQELIKPQMDKANLEEALITILDPKMVDRDKAAVLRKQMDGISRLFRGNDFLKDLEDLEKNLSHLIAEKKRRYKEYTIEDSDKWEDLLLCGTEVLGSCQSINREEDLNKCLLGYIMDGKNRLVVIKDATGKIVARRIVRLLWDERNKYPVLFQERIYCSLGVTDEMQKAMDKMIWERAKKLGCILLEKYEEVASWNRDKEAKKSKIYKFDLHSYGSPAPFEYFDSSDGVIAGGRTTIKRGMAKRVTFLSCEWSVA